MTAKEKDSKIQLRQSPSRPTDLKNDFPISEVYIFNLS